MHSVQGKPLIVQSDHTVFVEVDHPDFAEVRKRLAAFAELEKSPKHVHIYRLTPLAMWNAAAAGLSAAAIVDFLNDYGKYPLPLALRKEITEFIGRYGLLRLENRNGALELRAGKAELLRELLAKGLLQGFLAESAALEMAAAHDEPGEKDGAASVRIRPECRGQVKVALIRLGYPVEDVAGYRGGSPLPFRLRERLPNGSEFDLRPYQREAVDAFWAGGHVTGGSGVVVLPCGAGKTIVGLGVLERAQTQALILSSNVTALRQWRRELLEKTTLDESSIGEYSGEQKEIRPVTLTTYQMLTYRRSRTSEFEHFKLFTAREWGLIVYDEVHLLPAPIFRLTAEIQATRRLGLTATLVREDGHEDEVFSLIGPKKHDMPWRSLENQGWIANATCVEVRVGMKTELARRYAIADNRGKFRLASENEGKLAVLKELVRRHAGDRVLVIGQYLDQLRAVRRELGAPLITGKTPNAEREALYAEFRAGGLPVLIVSKVGNFAVDLPDANVAIQISGTFGSRQEEAQRLGRVLRPKKDGRPAVFYSIVTRASRDQYFAEKRQLFLTEQGYAYSIQDFAAAADAMEQAS